MPFNYFFFIHDSKSLTNKLLHQFKISFHISCVHTIAQHLKPLCHAMTKCLTLSKH